MPLNKKSARQKPVMGLLAALICMACSAQGSTAALTLEDALRISAVEHPSVLARRSERNAADARLDVAERQQYPNLSFQSTGDGLGGRANTVRVEQPLWLGGRIKAGIDSANASIQQADASVVQAQTDIMLKVVASFTELGRIQARQVAARSNVQEHARLAQMIQRRVESEISPSSDSTLATARFSQARAELNQLDSLAVRARSTLGQAIGKPVADIVLPVQRDLLPYTLDQLTQAALDFSPAIRRLEGETEAATAEISARRSDALPQVKLRLDRTNSRSSSDTQIYVALDVQTGAGMSVQASIREAQARKDALQSQIDATRRETIDTVSADWADLKSFSEQARDLQKQVESTTSVFDSFVRQYAIGRKGWNDVLNAQREVAQARFQLADATWGELRASMRLHLLTGLITGERVALTGPTRFDQAMPTESSSVPQPSPSTQATSSAPHITSTVTPPAHQETFNGRAITAWDLITLPTPTRPLDRALTSPVPTVVVAESPVGPAASLSDAVQVQPAVTAPPPSPQ
ncbi:TolC family protein [Hydrogenophaga sp.]|uniref:TolC family protein n=1 Tax=Hydrogenophaga sp. TaxID=1904254 RepID=UPI0026136B88|nr:TolC family protein [Hydrogenophaga sp.]